MSGPRKSARWREAASISSVTVDDRGLVYLVDRVHGVDIIETSVFS